jgi:putative AbiEi antitoxin of type IV toxin-antitoxin system
MKTYIPRYLRCRLSYVPSDRAVLERLRSLGAVFRAKEAVGAGVSWRDLYRARDAGLVLELSRGLYQLEERAGLEGQDFITVCARAPRGMICLVSALAYWNLTDEIPSWVDLAVPSGAHRPRIDYPPTRVHVFSSSTFEIGRIYVSAGADVGFSITDTERTVVDCFRVRHRIGEELATGGLRRYLRRPNAKPGRILDVAEALRVRTSMLQALRLLQE